MPEYMSRVEMMAALTSKPGAKISHQYFAPGEYIYLGEDSNVYDENGYLFEDWTSRRNCGVRMRNGNGWEHGWYLL